MAELDECNFEDLEKLLHDEDSPKRSRLLVDMRGAVNHCKAAGNDCRNLEVANFLDESSDDNEDGPSSPAQRGELETDELEVLASLMSEDQEFCDVGSVDEQDEDGFSKITTNLMETKRCKETKDISGKQPKTSPPATQVKDLSTKTIPSKDLTTMTNLDKISPSLPTPEFLMEKMEEMQRRMLELQNLLLQQQSQSQEKTTIVSGKNSPEPRNKYAETSVHPQVMKNKTEGHYMKINKSLQILSDEGDNPFFGLEKKSCQKGRSAQQQKNQQKNQGKRFSKRQEMSKDLFGDSDSDWEDMGGEEKIFLSEAGKDLKKLIQSGVRQREAHQPKYNLKENSSGNASSWVGHSSESTTTSTSQDSGVIRKPEKQSKDSLQCKYSSTEQANPVLPAAEEPCVVDIFSKIRIVNPLVSSSMMKTRMENRKMIDVSKIHLKLNTPDVQGDWVTIAVCVGKTESKVSKSGKPYAIWRLSDLEDMDNSVSFFLFGEVYKNHWKLEVGTVIGVLNPSIMESMEKANSELAFTVKHPNQLMVMGRSKDLGWCISKTKKGNKCSKFINKRLGEFCEYHVQAEYRRTSSKRLELHGSITGIKPKSFEKRIFSKDCAYIYGGKTFVPQSSKGNHSSRKVTLSKLQKTIGAGRLDKVNTLSIQGVKAASSRSQERGRIEEDADNSFANMISVPSPGSMNLVAFLKKKEEAKRKTEQSVASQGIIQSITPKELIRQHQRSMKERHLEKKKASDQLLASTSMINDSQKALEVSFKTHPVSNVNPMEQVPTLGKGFYSGQSISFDVGSASVSAADRAKMKAIALVRQRGGIEKPDPNAVNSKIDVDLIKKKVNDCGKCSNGLKPSSSKGSASSEPPKKKSRLLGDVDLNSSEFKAIMKAKSKHKGALAEAECEREEAYFTELEKKERLEEKMKTITSLEISVFTCRQCQYTAQSALDTCRKGGHIITKSKTKKRFFACKKCKQKTAVIGGKFPTETCKNCGSLSFEKTSMYKERAGPKLDSEVLSLRGDEVKYLGSLNQQIFLNTVIDD